MPYLIVYGVVGTSTPSTVPPPAVARRRRARPRRSWGAGGPGDVLREVGGERGQPDAHRTAVAEHQHRARPGALPATSSSTAAHPGRQLGRRTRRPRSGRRGRRPARPGTSAPSGSGAGGCPAWRRPRTRAGPRARSRRRPGRPPRARRSARRARAGWSTRGRCPRPSSSVASSLRLRAAGHGEAAAVVGEQVGLVLRLAVPGDQDARAVQVPRTRQRSVEPVGLPDHVDDAAHDLGQPEVLGRVDGGDAQLDAACGRRSRG